MGVRLVAGLTELQERVPDMLSQARGQGTFAAIDVVAASARDRVVKAAQRAGVEVGGSGQRSIRFRPSLIFGDRHVAELLERLEAAVRTGDKMRATRRSPSTA